ncbi:Sel1 [Candidatus Koribacter versatilis Ellin345]|uniref:Sel1 n=1 Tax=Koribacter versatilis (strain Ellin345) TaxID=204669 RepID=Q1IJP6_KORVE|nr:SEL1-like repeat protein [Candidatus Koribacter versatilis]ABF42904.1 Sel1 [Candidatus Koribacter versatilis Ellin345]
MICPKCQSENPELNRFCGACGSRLQETAPVDQARPSNGNDANKPGVPGVRRPFIVSTTAMADVTAQMLNTRVVLPSPSVASATHSGYVAPLKPRVEHIAHGEDLPEPEIAPVDPNDEPMFAEGSVEQQEGTVHEFDLDSPEEKEAEEWLERTVAEHEAHMPPPRTETPGSILNLSAPVESVASERLEEPPVEQEPVRNSFLQFDPPSESTGGSVSGPSFLGLDEPPSQDYLLEESGSHTGRNLVLVAIVAIVAAMGYLEWRASSRGESTNPVDVLHLKLPKKKGQGPAEVATSTTTSPGGSSTTESANNSGKPDLIAEPNQPAAQSSAAAGNSQTSATPAPNANPGTAEANPPSTAAATTNAAGTSSPQPAAAATKSTPPPVEKQTTEVAKNTPPPAKKPEPLPQSDAATAKPTASKPAAAIASKPPTPAAQTQETDPTLNAGGAELQKGKAAGATDDGRMWLWKAVAKGNGEAPVLLADMYLQGRGVPKDCEQAMLLLNAAAKKANPRARSRLGSLYATGECVSQDRVQAYKWMTSALAANPGSDWIEKNRQQLLSQMTASERKRAAAIQ